MTTYTATLFDARGLTDADKRAAEETFCKYLEATLGGADQVAPACAAYDAAFKTHGTIPLPAEATDAERAAVARWEDAEQAATSRAFEGWHNMDSGAHFEVAVQAE